MFSNFFSFWMLSVQKMLINKMAWIGVLSIKKNLAEFGWSCFIWKWPWLVKKRYFFRSIVFVYLLGKGCFTNIICSALLSLILKLPQWKTYDFCCFCCAFSTYKNFFVLCLLCSFEIAFSLFSFVCVSFCTFNYRNLCAYRTSN